MLISRDTLRRSYLRRQNKMEEELFEDIHSMGEYRVMFWTIWIKKACNYEG